MTEHQKAIKYLSGLVRGFNSLSKDFDLNLKFEVEPYILKVLVHEEIGGVMNTKCLKPSQIFDFFKEIVDKRRGDKKWNY